MDSHTAKAALWPLLCAFVFIASLSTAFTSASAETPLYVYEYENGLPVNPPKPDYKPGKKYKKIVLPVQKKSAVAKSPSKSNQANNKTQGKIRFGSIDLPRILSDTDADLYRKAFQAAEQGRWRDLDDAIAQVKNPILKGHALAEKYRSSSYRAELFQLVDWLKAYGDHPDAQRLARIASDKGASSLPPHKGRESGLPIPSLEKVSSHRWSQASSYRPQRRAVLRQIREALYDDRYGDAETTLAYEARSYFDEIEIQRQYARIAGEIYYDGTIDEALRRARNVISAVGDDAPYAYWIAGLCAWRLKDYNSAARYFKSSTSGLGVTRWDRSAGYFWAARAHGKLGDANARRKSLEQAAKYHETFYGLLARRRLEWKTKSNVGSYTPKKSDIDRIMTWKAGKRAFALFQVGQYRRAELELANIARKPERKLRRTLLRITEAAHLPELSVRLGHLKTANDKSFDYRGLYPIPIYDPKGGYTIDKAILYGIMKKESVFNPKLKSSAGATGLLQVYPPTAKWMVKKGMVKPFTPNKLLIPRYNIAIGQRYLKYLLKENKSVQRDLIRFLVGYNAGPNRIKRWEARADHGGDPLLFMESIPALETRVYVEKVLNHIWRYRDRMGQSLREADELAAGRWPRYREMD